MSLPKIDLPIYEVELPSTGKKIRYRPFTVREEKILLTAQETKEPKQIILAIKQILNNCLIGFDVDKLAVFDFEYLLIILRSKSVDNIAEFEIKDPETEELVKLQIDVSNIKVQKDPSHTNKIDMKPYTLFLRYPNIDELEIMLNQEEKESENAYKIMMSCLDKLASEESVYSFKDYSQAEVDEFIEGMNSDVINKIKKFFETMPKIRHEIPYINTKGTQKTFVIQGVQSFFI
jgi:hypothetical protein